MMFLLTSTTTFAQKISVNFSQDEVLSQLLVKVDSLVIANSEKFHFYNNGSDATIAHLYDTLETLSFDSTSNYGSLLNETISEKNIASNNIGLRFRTGYRENIEEGFFSGGDIFYQRRFNAGFQWDLLDNGWYDHSQRRKELEVREKMVQRDIKRLQANEQYERLYNRLIYVFNQHKIDVLEQYLTLVNINLELMQRLHYLDYEPWESVLELSELKARLENNLISYKTYNKQFNQNSESAFLKQITSLDAAKLPHLDIDVETIASINDTLFQQQSLTQEDLEKLNYRIIRDVNLSAYFDYNIYDGIGNGLDPDNIAGREYFSVGVNLSIPLPLNKREKKEMVEERKARYIKTEQREQYSEQKEIYNIDYEYKYKRQQLIQLYKDFQSRQESIQISHTLYRLNDLGFSAQRLMHLILQRYSTVFELIDLKQQMYLQLINLDRYLEDQSVFEFTSVLDISSLFPYKSVQAAGIYIWSDILRENSNQMLLELFQNIRLREVYLSLGPDQSLLEKTKDFITSANKLDIKSHLLVGNNGLIDPQNQTTKLQSYAEIAILLGASGVHLNVEPHTFDDWDVRREIYEEQFIDMVIAASSLFKQKNLSLSVSIPHFYDSIVSKLEPHVESISVMVYKTTDIQTLKRRIKTESEVLGKKLQVVIRPTDFDNFDQLNRFIQKIITETAANGVFLHDAGSLMNIDITNR